MTQLEIMIIGIKADLSSAEEKRAQIMESMEKTMEDVKKGVTLQAVNLATKSSMMATVLKEIEQLREKLQMLESLQKDNEQESC